MNDTAPDTGDDTGANTGADTVRLDLWLWRARFFRTRSLAARAIKANRFRINRRIVAKTSRQVRAGDVLTFPHGPDIHVVEVLEIGQRRGAAAEARLLYRHLAALDA